MQGGDLTVRGGRVWMKSLEGLRRIDIILRRVDDFFCDPVELLAATPNWVCQSKWCVPAAW